MTVEAQIEERGPHKHTVESGKVEAEYYFPLLAAASHWSALSV